MDQLVTFAIWIVSWFVFTLLHELGHAAMSRVLFGDRAWVITMGAGRSVFTSKRFVIKSWFFLGGRARFSVHSGRIYKHVLRSAGGFIVNIVFAVLIIVSVLHLRQYAQLYDSLFWWLIVQVTHIAFVVNVILAVTTMIPIVYPFGPLKGMASDGLWIWRLLTNPGKYTVKSGE